MVNRWCAFQKLRWLASMPWIMLPCCWLVFNLNLEGFWSYGACYAEQLSKFCGDAARVTAHSEPATWRHACLLMPSWLDPALRTCESNPALH